MFFFFHLIICLSKKKIHSLLSTSFLFFVFWKKMIRSVMVDGLKLCYCFSHPFISVHAYYQTVIFVPHLYSSNFLSCCSVTKLCPTICNPMDPSTQGFPVLHQLPELAQSHVHWVGDAIQCSHPLLSPSPPAFNLSLHQGLFQ